HAQFFSYSLLFFSYFTRSLAFLSTFIFFLQCPAHPRDLPSFPTRRSSDLSLSLRVNKASRAAGSNPAPGGRSRRPRRGRRPPRPARPGRRGFDAAPPPCRSRLPSPPPPACTGSSAAGRRGSCTPPSRCG